MSLRPLRAALQAWRPATGVPSDPLFAIVGAWAEIVGPQVAAHCAPVELHGETLVVATRSSAWSAQLQFLSATILTRVGALGASKVARLAFRSGGLRRAARVAAPTSPGRRPARRGQAPLEPAVDAWDALERVRRRINRLQHVPGPRCPACGVGLPVGAKPEPCAPCVNGTGGARFVAAQRALYAMPWLDFGALREHVAGLQPGEYDRARRHLLSRWWVMLERARRAGQLSAGGVERRIAGAYVLLHSRLPPDRVTPAVAANLLGVDLAGLVWGDPPDSSKYMTND